MKIIVNRAALLEALELAGMAVAKRTPKPILTCVLLVADGSTIVVTGTDLEQTIRCTIAQAQIESSGSVAVGSEKFRSIVREVKDDTLTLEYSDHETFRISGGDSNFKLPTQLAKDFPAEKTGMAESFNVNSGELLSVFNRVSFAAAIEPGRYNFNGVLMKVNAQGVTAVATDGRRLALSTASGSKLTGASPDHSMIIPSSAVRILAKAIEDREDSVIVAMSESAVQFTIGDTILWSALVEGQFPPYDDVIPKDADKKMTASAPDFLSAIRRASLLTTDESRGVRFHFSKKGLIITSRSPESGEATINFACKYEGPDMEIGFNPKYMQDAITASGANEVTLEMTASNRPGLLRGGGSFLCVVMPVNLQ